MGLTVNQVLRLRRFESSPSNMKKTLAHIERWFMDHPVLTDLLTILVPFLFFVVLGICSNSCSSLKEVPVQYIDRIEYRDSLVYIHDSVEVPVPYEVVKEVLPALDTSVLKTSNAESVAYLDTARRMINHTLEQKGTVKTVIDTVIKVEYVDRLIEKEVPVEVEVVKYRRDALFWVLVGWAVICVAYAIMKILR